MHLDNFEYFFSPLQWQVILTTAQIAKDLNLRAFAVGGIVRDAVINRCQQGRSLSFPKDLDLVFDGAEQAGIKVAITLHQKFPQSKLQIHEKFQTAELLWQGLVDHADFAIDMATARQEVYAYAGANPQVTATAIAEDLQRRDFTINALAVRLDPKLGTDGEVIDQFEGLRDLVARQVRAIRENSFAEDPRRLFRAVRFAVRLGLAIAPETYTEIINTTASGLHDAIGGARLRAELLYTLAEPKAAAMFALLDKLGILRCIHPNLHLPNNENNTFRQQWRRSQYWLNSLKHLDKKILSISPLQIGLELLLSYLEPAIATQLNLGLTPDQQNRLFKLAELTKNLPSVISNSSKVSELTQYLQKFDAQNLILGAVKSEPEQRRLVWQYLTRWQLVKAPLTGDDLKQMGYPSGKQMGALLQILRSLMLDGEITNQSEAIAYLQKHHPLDYSALRSSPNQEFF